MLNEFKKFLNRGNVVDLAVAVVIGTAFGAVVKSFVDNILMQLVGALIGKSDFSALKIGVGESHLYVGSFLNSVVAFVTVAFGVFLVVKAINAIRGVKDEDEGPTESELLAEIRDLLKNR